MKDLSGIYKIQSKRKPERIYIGSAKNVRKRWVRHKVDLKNNAHGSSKLQRHYNKYGKDDFKFVLLVECNPEELIQTEQFFIDSYNPFFNTCPKAYSPAGRPIKDETREKLRKANLGKKGHPAWNKGKAGVYSAERIEALREALKNRPPLRLNIPHTLESRAKMSESKRGQIPWNKGKRASDEAKKNQSLAHMGHVPWNKGKKGTQVPVNKRPIMQYSKNGDKLKEWPCIHYAEMELGISHGNIMSALAGRQITAGGFVWKYLKVA